MAVSGTITIKNALKEVQNLINLTGDRAAAQSITIPFNFGTTDIAVTDGTGNLQITKVWGERRTLAATTYTYDLTALAVPNASASGTGSPVLAFTKIKLVYVVSESTTDGQILYLGNAASNIWSAPFDTAANRIKIMPSSPWEISNLYSQGTNPWTVDSSNKNVKLDSGANTITYQILFAGV